MLKFVKILSLFLAVVGLGLLFYDGSGEAAYEEAESCAVFGSKDALLEHTEIIESRMYAMGYNLNDESGNYLDDGVPDTYFQNGGKIVAVYGKNSSCVDRLKFVKTENKDGGNYFYFELIEGPWQIAEG